MSNSLWPHKLQHARILCPSPTPGVHPNPCPLSRWCHPTVTRVYVPWFFVSSQQRFRATDIKALGASQLSGLGQTMLQLLGKSVLQLYFIYKIAGESKTWREESGGVRGEGKRESERQKERERAHMHAGESRRESTLAPPFICFFLHLGLPYANWA